MNVKLVRFIDYWIGIPVCFLLSLLNGIRKFLSRAGPKASLPQKIIFLEFSEMGSAVLTYSAMVRAKKLYPKAELYFWIFQENREVLSFIDAIPKENIITIRFQAFLPFIGDILWGVWKMRSKRIDTAVDLELFSRFSAILTFLSGAQRRAGFNRYGLEGLYRGSLHTHRVQYNPYLHIKDNFLALVESFQEDLNKIPLVKKEITSDIPLLPVLKIREKDKEVIKGKIKQIKQGVILENKGIVLVRFDFADRVGLRIWPKPKYLRLISKLLEDEGLVVALVGKEREQAEDLEGHSRLVNLTGMTTLKELVTLFTVSKVFAGHDGGMTHLASLSPIYIVAMYGPETPVLYGLLNKNKYIIYKRFQCSPCVMAYNHRKSVCTDNKCMKAISVEEVYNSIKKAL